jgi:hypothetical protein
VAVRIICVGVGRFMMKGGLQVGYSTWSGILREHELIKTFFAGTLDMRENSPSRRALRIRNARTMRRQTSGVEGRSTKTGRRIISWL